jgi:hypothetical protein
MPGQYLAQA